MAGNGHLVECNEGVCDFCLFICRCRLLKLSKEHSSQGQLITVCAHGRDVQAYA